MILRLTSKYAFAGVLGAVAMVMLTKGLEQENDWFIWSASLFAIASIAFSVSILIDMYRDNK
jgi:hypothetical protein